MRIFQRLLPVMVAALAFASPSPSKAAVDVAITVTVAPPPLPVYAQPVIPGDGYIWTPGYWAWGPYGYYWVPGTWVLPPAVGLLWTPGFWAWDNGVYLWHAGYWGPDVGFYGGINYGFGYIGVGYLGGFWDHGAFRYNRAANNFGRVHITNVYNRTIVNNTQVTRVSFNGGRGGTRARPSAAQEAFAHENHQGPTGLQVQHEHAAGTNHASLASVNHGRPTIAATPQAAAFTGRGMTGARGATASPNTGLPRGPAHPASTATLGHAPGPGVQSHGQQPHAQRSPAVPQAARPVSQAPGHAAPPNNAPHNTPAEHGGGPHEKGGGPRGDERHREDR